jgi:dTDP-L-rhamnose 4-epimerase
MRVLVTGGAGFIGSSLVKSLKKHGHEVTVIDALTAQIHGDAAQARQLLQRDAGWAGVVFEHADVRDPTVLERLLADTDAVVHLAAETGTGQSMYRIAHYYDVNVQATAALLEAIALRHRHVRRIVLASSRAVYGEGAYRDPAGTLLCPEPRSAERMRAGQFEPLGANGEALSLTATPESLPPKPASVYAATKLANETLGKVLAEAHGIAVTALRFQNVYGAGQSLQNPYTGILSIFSNRMRQGLGVNIFEDGLESRDFVHVGDAVRAIELALGATASRPATFSVLNIGSGTPTSVMEVASLLRGLLGSKSELRVSGDFRAGDIRHCYADLSLARRLIDFAPRMNLEQGLREFCAWTLEQPIFTDQSEQAQGELDRLGLGRTAPGTRC